MSDKRIETVELLVSDLKFGFDNPRKIAPKKLLELEKSFEDFGDFGVFVIDDENNLISGSQRAKALLRKNPSEKVLCKKMIGYSRAELRCINIKANTHAGEWDLDILSTWTADLTVELEIKAIENDGETSKVKDMELIRYEGYDYVLLVCKNQNDYIHLCERLGIDGAKTIIAKNKKGHRKIKARAVWYDDIQAQIIEKK
jgi:hypothetical protein